MKSDMNLKRTLLAVLATSAIFSVAVEAQPVNAGPRAEIWLGVPNWPALGDLTPEAGGAFDRVGFGLGAGWYTSVGRNRDGRLLIGLDGFIAANDSNVAGVIDDALARTLYIGGAVKWALGPARNGSLDVGLGWYLADIAQVSNRAFGAEYEAWESSKTGASVGTTWDIGAGRSGRHGGLMLALRVHFVDFGTVRDEEVFFAPLLGPDAGPLDGPLYMLQIGYSWR